MRVKKTDFNSFKCWLSVQDVKDWIHKPNSYWPCSTLNGKRIYFEISRGDLVDLNINGKTSINYDGYEMQVLIQDKQKEIMGAKND